jgi:predicted RNA binding protein YcfA (HicA-like mRNA interferase family)
MPRLPGVNHLSAIRALQKAGLRIARQSKHVVMTNGQSSFVLLPVFCGYTFPLSFLLHHIILAI